MLRLLFDENINRRVLRGLKLRLPGLDYKTAQEVGLKGTPDPDVLASAAEQNRILVTHDLKKFHLCLRACRRRSAYARCDCLRGLTTYRASY